MSPLRSTSPLESRAGPGRDALRLLLGREPGHGGLAYWAERLASVSDLRLGRVARRRAMSTTSGPRSGSRHERRRPEWATSSSSPSTSGGATACRSLGHPVVRTPNLDRLAADGRAVRPPLGATSRRAGRAGPRCYTGMYLRTTGRCSTARRSTPASRTSRSRRAAAGLRPGAVRLHRHERRPARPSPPTTPGCAPTRGCCPASTPVLDLREPSTSAWGDVAARRRASTSRATSRDLYRADRSFPGAATTARRWAPTALRGRAHRDRVPHRRRSSTGSTQRARRRAVVRARQLTSGRTRRTAPRRRTTTCYDPADGRRLPAATPTREAERALHPLAAMAIGIPGVSGARPTSASSASSRATYYGMMTEVDDQLGRLFDWLDAAGRPTTRSSSSPPTTATDGRPLAPREARLLGRELPRAADRPRPPAASRRHAGTVVDAFTEHVDVMPTILRVAGLEVPLQCDGRSLARRSCTAATRRPTGAPRCTGSGTSAPRPTTWPRTCSALTMEQCCLDVLRDDRCKYVHFGRRLHPAAAVRPRARSRPVREPGRRPGARRGAGRVRRADAALADRHIDRTFTGHSLSPDGLVVRRDPRV